jgi:hypothetical protein
MTEYIERGALIGAIEATEFLTMQDAATTLQLVTEAPAADVEPVVHGVWVEMHDPYGDLTGWIHEECGRETTSADEYCSKCGAKMTFVERSEHED